MQRVVKDRSGRTWTVRRRIAWPRRRSIGLGLPPLDLDPTGITFLFFLPLVLAIVLVTFFSVIAVVAEAAVVIVAAYLWRGRWLIEATTGDRQEPKTWEARGLVASRRKFNQAVRELTE